MILSSHLQHMINVYIKWRLHRRYKEGKVLSRPIALDVYREILIINSSKVEDGTITGRVRTINRLYVEFGGMEEPEFGGVKELRINEMWHWTGQPWGGLPDGTSLVNPSMYRRSLNKN